VREREREREERENKKRRKRNGGNLLISRTRTPFYQP